MLQKPVTKHVWSEGFPVYEGIYGCECRGCGARVMTVAAAPTDDELSHARLPLDCDDAVPVVLHEEYLQWDGGDLWNEEDALKKPVFKDDLQGLEAVETEEGGPK